MRALCIFASVFGIYALPVLADLECNPRDYGNGGTVCVCNADYCDSIGPVNRITEGRYIQYSSSQAGLRFKKTEGDFKYVQQNLVNEIRVNSNKKFQTIMGFGGAFTDSTGINIISLENKKTRNFLMRSYFSNDGLEYNLCRVPIGGTDFSTRGYTYDDYTGDKTLSKFNLTQEDYEYKIPLMKQGLALSGNKLKFFASAWSPPIWMKTNNELYGPSFLLDDMYQVWADYHLKFLDFYKKEGINFWGITTGNEPSSSFIPLIKLNSLGWTLEKQIRWIKKNFGPTIKSKYPDIKIMLLDDQRSYLPWIKWMLMDDTVYKYIDGTAVHWYFDKIFSPILLEEFHNFFPNKFILGTEACIFRFLLQWIFDSPVELGSWSRGEQYAEDIIEDLSHWVTGWVDWNMVLDMNGGPTYTENLVDAPIIVNSKMQEFYKQPTYYTLGHFAKFLPPGSVRIDTKFNGNAKVLAFTRPDNGTAVILYNNHNQDVTVNLIDNRRGVITTTITEHSINTILYW